MREYLLDIHSLNQRGHSYLKEALDLPCYYGENFDALFDILSERELFKIKIRHHEDANAFSMIVLELLNDVKDEYENLIIE